MTSVFFAVLIYLDPRLGDVRAGELADKIVAFINGALLHVFAKSEHSVSAVCGKYIAARKRNPDRHRFKSFGG